MQVELDAARGQKIGSWIPASRQDFWGYAFCRGDCDGANAAASKSLGDHWSAQTSGDWALSNGFPNCATREQVRM